jgi:hypothetical protein
MTASTSQTPAQLPHHKVKIKKAGQRACNEKNEEGQVLRRPFEALVLYHRCHRASLWGCRKSLGTDAEVYRCEHCQMLYLPNPEEAKVNVAGQGMISVFGLTLPPKEK